jgi:hypothetical protein
MPRYNCTLNFTFERRYGEHDEYLDHLDAKEYEDSYADSDAGSEKEDALSDATDLDEFSPEVKAEAEAFRRTDIYYRTHRIEDHVKSNHAFSFVEYVCCDGEVISAEWDKKKFQIHMVVETEQTKEQLIEDLRSNSLEDGEYEACGDTGWVVFTRGKNGEIFNGGLDMSDFWPYGLTDYRDNPIEVEEIKQA